MYEGHSGPFYGFALANWNKTTERDLDDSDMRVIAMPKDRYQVVLAEGCDTYSANADCGGPGNLCVAKKCTAACTDTSGCGAGYACKSVGSAATSTIYGKACAKN